MIALRSGVDDRAGDDLEEFCRALPRWSKIRLVLVPLAAYAQLDGRLQFIYGNTGGWELISLSRVVSADVDHDGVADGVAVVSCEQGQAAYEQVIVFHRDSNADVQPLARVTATDGNTLRIEDLKVDADGSVRVQVSNRSGTDGNDFWSPMLQWRTYRWSGGRFTQTAGPTSFPAR